MALCTRKDGLVILNGEDVKSNDLLEQNELNAAQLIMTKDRIDSLLSKDDGGNFEISLKGKHNYYNAAIAIEIARHLEMDDTRIQEALNTFKPIEHRMEFVARIDDVEFINDSKATNVEASFVALEAVDPPLVWIAGGTDKGNDYSSLVPLIKKKAVMILCLCKDDTRLKEAFGDLNIEMQRHEDMKEIVHLAKAKIKSGTVLLSPACASFDLFKNYEDRGNKFKKAVAEIIHASDQ